MLQDRFFSFISLFLIASLALAGGASAFASSVDGIQDGDTARVKVAHFAPFAGTLEGTAVTIQVDGAEALADFKFGDMTGYLDFAPGEYLIEILPSGSGSVAISGTVSLAAGMDYTLSAIGDGANQPLELFTLIDDHAAPASGAKLRIAHLAPFAGTLPGTEVAICTDTGDVVAGLTNVPYKAFTDPYLELPAGDYDLQIAAPGTDCDTMYLDIPPVRLGEGDIVDVFAIGDDGNQPLQIASGTGFQLSPPARVKVAHFAPFAGTLEGTAVTVQVDGAEALADFKFGDMTGYLDFAPGEYLIEILPSGSDTVAISGTVSLAAGQHYTLAAIGDGSNQPLELFALLDEATPLPMEAKLRIAHLAPFAAILADTEVDICTETGDLVAGLANIPYKAFTAPYLVLPPGEYDLKVTAAGSDCGTTLIDVPAVTLEPAQIASAFAIGDGTNFDPTIHLDAVQGKRIFLPAVLK